MIDYSNRILKEVKITTLFEKNRINVQSLAEINVKSHLLFIIYLRPIYQLSVQPPTEEKKQDDENDTRSPSQKLTVNIRDGRILI